MVVSTRRKAVIHIHSHTHVIHQRSHSCVLRIGSRFVVYVEHISPVESGLSEIERDLGILRVDGTRICV